jgi:hypothetical protein
VRACNSSAPPEIFRFGKKSHPKFQIWCLMMKGGEVEGICKIRKKIFRDKEQQGFEYLCD